MVSVVSNQDASCTLLVGVDASSVSTKELKESLEKGDVDARAKALEQMIRLHVNGEPQNHMIMSVIKYITPLDDHLIKKLVLYFWEVVDKTDSEGKLLSEMILICSFLREDLLHPNEYVRGLTLRFLYKVKERELLEPVISSVVQNLTHRVTYVRRSAVLAVHAIYQKFPVLLPDAPELVEKFINEENDVSARRNAFDMLVECAPDRAVRYLTAFRESASVADAGAAFQMSVVDFARQMIRANPYDKAKYVAILFSILQSKNPSVRYQCASTLLSLSSSCTAIQQAALTFIDLLKTHSDNSVRLIVVDQLDGMRAKFSDVLQESLLDVMSALSNGSMEIRRRVVGLAVELVSNNNVEVFLQTMKKELLRSQSEVDLVDQASMQEYKQLLIRAIRAAVVRQPQTAPMVLPMMMDYACDSSSSGCEVISFVRQILQVHPVLRADTIRQLMDIFPLISSSHVLRTVLWLFGAHVSSSDEAFAVLALLRGAMDPLPLIPPPAAAGANAGDFGAAAASANAAQGAAPAMQAITTVREDGTYATAYAAAPAAGIASAANTDGGADATSGLRALITGGEYFVASALANAFAKLIIQLFGRFNCKEAATEAQEAVLALLQEVLRYGTASDTPHPIDEDSQEHVRLAMIAIANPQSPFLTAFVDESYSALDTVEKSAVAGVSTDAEPPNSAAATGTTFSAAALGSIDAPVVFAQLAQGKDAVLELEVADDLGSAVENASLDRTDEFLKRLEKTTPLSGFSDPVYCEATVTVHQFDISVDWFLVNRTAQRLQDLTIELASLGGMKLCERPQIHTVAPHGTLKLRTALKVSSTETGVLYGNILYDAPNGERCCVILNNIYVDIMDYIKPAFCLTSEFREKWGTFDWENTVMVNTDKTDLREYVELVMRETNMQLLEPYPEVDAEEVEGLSSAEDDYEYVSCSMYARTVFGEDALANVSIERDSTGNISGAVRIRSNTQSIAFGIGERLNTLNSENR